MKKLTAYKQSLKDLTVIREAISELNNKINNIGSIVISSTVTLTSSSSDIQFIYAIGILNSQILACKELSMDTASREKSKGDCKELMVLAKELTDWKKFKNELTYFNNEVYDLLNDEEKFSLLNYPKKCK